MAKIDITTAKNVIESNPRKAYFKIKNTGGPKGADGAPGATGATGPQGPQGPQGKAATVTVGSTTTLPAGSNATVTNSGDQYDAVLEFGIPTGPQGPTGATGAQGPRGFQGEKGAKGDTGAAATITLGSVSTGAAGSDAAIVNTGDEHNAVYNFTIPRGAKGDTGTSPTVSVYGTQTLPAGSQATVTNVGTSQDVQLQFGIPQGEAGKNTKLYSSTGQNTDGAMTQKATTDALAPKLEAGVVESLPATGEEGKLYLTPKSYTTGTATGNPITITLGEEAGQITDAQLDGDTYQQSYTGKNCYIAANTSSRGIVETVNDDGTFNLVGTASGNAYLINYSPLALMENGATYTWWTNLDNLPSGLELRLAAAKDNSWVRNMASPMSSTNVSRTFTANTTGDVDQIRCEIWVKSGTTLDLHNIQIQLEKSATKTDFEPYVGGVPSPNPDYPQQIQTVTGTQTVEVTGKNLFDKNNYNELACWINNSGVLQTGNNWTFWIPCLPSTTYTIQKMVQQPESKNRFQIATSSVIPALGVQTSGRWSVADGDTTTSHAYTTAADASYLIFNVGNYDTNPSTTTTKQQILKSIQVELGSTATSYSAYSKQTLPISLGSIELCKLGTYQDYIYKSGSDWKVHKATSKTTITNLSTITGVNSTSENTTRVNFSGVLDPIPNGLTASDRLYSKSDHFSAISNYNGDSVGIYFSNTSSGDTWFRANKTEIGTTEDSVKAWLVNNPVKLYYPIPTATDTAITDTNLIAQLEAVRNATLQASNTITNTATGTNLAGDLELAYEEYNPTNRYDKWIWLDLNNNYEQIGS